MKKKKNCPGTKKVSVNSQKVPVNLKIARELFFQKVPVNLASAREPFYEKVPVNFDKLPVNIKIMSGRFPTLKDYPNFCYHEFSIFFISLQHG